MTVQDVHPTYELRTLDEFERACDQALALAATATGDEAQADTEPIGTSGWISVVGLVTVLILIGLAYLPGVA